MVHAVDTAFVTAFQLVDNEHMQTDKQLVAELTFVTRFNLS